MASEKMICPNCGLPLSSQFRQSPVACPRCATWLEIDITCNGVCSSCQAAANAAGTCARSKESPSALNLQSSELEGEGAAKPDAAGSNSHCLQEPLSKKNSVLESFKALFKRAFHVL